ncbi:uncharacterized protein LOC132943851 [Metopolophium dirhodum]|uniref:uncharacterized protein LOC132943851 n=1 Tax=Metopolophium dirhodum TaxID=44670 RepID=UPI00298FCF5F|nr:uncharacterized protein LOC132943851 [Metopolophium dirhodum]
MFSCVVCKKVYVRKSDLTRHATTHGEPANTCGICFKTFTRRNNLNIHVQNCHMIAKNTPEFYSAVRIGGSMGRASIIMRATPITTPHTQSDVRPPTVNLSRRRAGTSTPPLLVSSTTFCTPAVVTPSPAQPIATCSDAISPATTAHARLDSPPSNVEGVSYTENTQKNIKWKNDRMQTVNTHGFIEIESSLNRTLVWYFRKNVDNVASYRAFLNTIESELIQKLRECVRIGPIIYNLKLETTYVIPNLHNSAHNNAFKTSARELYAHSNVESLIDRDFTRLLAQEHSYAEKFSGFALSCIDGLLLSVCENTPVEGIDVHAVPGKYSESEGR